MRWSLTSVYAMIFILRSYRYHHPSVLRWSIWPSHIYEMIFTLLPFNHSVMFLWSMRWSLYLSPFDTFSVYEMINPGLESIFIYLWDNLYPSLHRLSCLSVYIRLWSMRWSLPIIVLHFSVCEMIFILLFFNSI